MAAGAFGHARNYGWEGPFKVFMLLNQDLQRSGTKPSCVYNMTYVLVVLHQLGQDDLPDLSLWNYRGK